MDYQINLKDRGADLQGRVKLGHYDSVETHQLFILLAIAERLEALVEIQASIADSLRSVEYLLSELGRK